MDLPVPDSNGWPFDIPDRPFVPAIRCEDVQVGDWIRHERALPQNHKFWQVEATDTSGYNTAVRFVTQPLIPIRLQPHRIVLPRGCLVEIRLLWPGTVSLLNSTTVLEIGTGETRTEGAGRARVVDWWKQHTTRQETEHD